MESRVVGILLLAASVLTLRRGWISRFIRSHRIQGGNIDTLAREPIFSVAPTRRCIRGASEESRTGRFIRLPRGFSGRDISRYSVDENESRIVSTENTRCYVRASLFGTVFFFLAHATRFVISSSFFFRLLFFTIIFPHELTTNIILCQREKYVR